MGFMKKKCQQNGNEATVYQGEAPESDDEILAFSSVSLSRAQEVTEVYRPSPRRIRREASEETSILQKSLGECHISSVLKLILFV